MVRRKRNVFGGKQTPTQKAFALAARRKRFKKNGLLSQLGKAGETPGRRLKREIVDARKKQRQKQKRKDKKRKINKGDNGGVSEAEKARRRRIAKLDLMRLSKQAEERRKGRKGFGDFQESNK